MMINNIYIDNNKNVNKKEILNVKEKILNTSYKKCYLSTYNSKVRIVHLIITRFLMEFWKANDFPKKLYRKDYILNGIRVMKKYLFPSLENQNCKNFTWILLLGNKINITNYNSLFNFNNTFESKVIKYKDLKNYMRNITKGFDILITTTIDYDDRIYYNAVNDVRKAINITKPIILYGYLRGFFYYEEYDKYYNFYNTYKNQGAHSIFLSLITVLNKVNDTYSIIEFGGHMRVRKILIEKYKSFGIKELNYEPAIFVSGEPKFVWVRQKYSGSYIKNKSYPKGLKVNNFNLSKFYGK